MKPQRHYARAYVQRADGDEAGKPLSIIAATEGRKGDGLNLTMAGARLERFESNPVVGYGHSYWGRDGLPIGRADKTWIDGDKLRMDLTFDQDDEFAVKVERKYRARMMNAFSIGFDVWNIGEDGVPEGWELFEVSAVPLPMDPNAIVESGRALDLVRGLDVRHAPDETVQAVLSRLAELDAAGARAGAVLSKKNKGLVQAARDALQELLDAAGGTDDGAAEDDERAAPAADHARLLRLAGI
ncbi:hypothetical protein HHL19_36365 [Streptomyces sp. R302]|uniref:hypothetical protein n=1 Tax=unclassified Streptomyces TaxID=2593676 RepID=UPI00145F7589|nr:MULTISPECIES: hypothetical protein [unclassified Streptomyces]NML55672.1 hypothetical protein [Streptomyces sp. R301]NML83986.1 hypothetical protein [Streptomyces sp. R302]